MLWISPGKEEEFRYLQGWLAASAALEQVIEVTECVGDASAWPPDAATDNALSRRVGSFRTSTNMRGPADTPPPLFPAAGQGRSTVLVHLYVAEKLRELDRDRLSLIRLAESRKIESHRVPVLSRLAAVTGRSMRRVGEALELWATPANERETLRGVLARTRRSD